MPDLLTDVDRLEKLYLTTMLGSAVGVNDSLQDLRRKFYGGLADGTIGLLGPLGLQSYTSTRYYFPDYGAGNAGTLAMTLNQVRYSLFKVFKRQTFDRIAVSVNVAAATAIIRLGIYRDSGGTPGTLLKEFGSTVDASTTGQKEIIESTILDAGTYFIAVVNQTAGVTMDSRSSNAHAQVNAAALADIILANGTPTQTGVAGALPGTAAPDGRSQQNAAVALRAA